MKTATLVLIIAAVVVVGGACIGIPLSGAFDDTPGTPGSDPAQPTETPVEPTPTETPTETPTPSDVPLAYFSGGGYKSDSGNSDSEDDSNAETETPTPECEHEWQPQHIEGTDTHQQVCVKCGEPGSITDCTEKLGNFVYVDGSNPARHNGTCSDCGHIVKDIQCSLTCEDNNYGTHNLTCSENCGYEKICPPDYKPVEGEPRFHNTVCSECDETLIANVPCNWVYRVSETNLHLLEEYCSDCEQTSGDTITVKDGTEIITYDGTKTLHKILTDNTDAGSGNSVVIIPAGTDLDLKGEEWTPITVDGQGGADVITIYGNGNTIKGLTAPLFRGGFAGNSGIIIKDLTIADSTIKSTNTQGSGAFIETVDAMDVINLTNCHLKDSKITGSRTGGLIGWTSGYNKVTDGPVKTYVTIEACSVVNTTIENTFSDDGNIPHTESVGAIFGHAGANPWTFTTIKNCIIKDNTIIGGNGKTGVILGTANLGEVTITGCTIEGNTVNGAASDTVYGRTAFGTTGTLTIDGAQIT